MSEEPIPEVKVGVPIRFMNALLPAARDGLKHLEETRAGLIRHRDSGLTFADDDGKMVIDSDALARLCIYYQERIDLLKEALAYL